MRIDEHLAALNREGPLLVAAVSAGDLDTVIPTATGWTLRQLGHHIGQVHRWATAYVRSPRPTMMSPAEDALCWGEMPEDRDLAPWLEAGHLALVDALAAAPIDVRTWSFLAAPSPLAFWARRQAHETAIHRVDAQVAAGAPATGAQAPGAPAPEGGSPVDGGPIDGVDTAFAVDGVDELLLCFFSRPRNRVRSQLPRLLVIRASDADAAWVVRIGPDGARAERATEPELAGLAAEDPAAASLTGPAEALYYGLWNRAELAALDHTGDPETLALWRSTAHVRWS